MKRSATIDTNNSLSLCRYYYTHNTGSSDDVLLNSSATHRTPSDYAAIHPSERYTSPEWIPPRPQIRRQGLHDSFKKKGYFFFGYLDYNKKWFD